MKRFAPLCFTLLLLASCRVMGVCADKGGCDNEDRPVDPVTPVDTDCKKSKILGVWQNSSDNLLFNSSCQFQMNRCGAKGRFTSSTDLRGTIEVRIEGLTSIPKEGAGNCVPVGTYKAEFDIDRDSARASLGLRLVNAQKETAFQGTFSLYGSSTQNEESESEVPGARD